MTDKGREWTKHPMHVSRQWLVKLEKVQATTSSESGKCSFSSVHRELTGTEANNSNDTPGGTTWADHQSLKLTSGIRGWFNTKFAAGSTQN